ncbi:MAG: hypothetical protein LQ349_005937 [Xanthoria aureola]|nr:MAG: hypothetical protein LQ349_005937 [Xanthoria aureola]
MNFRERLRHFTWSFFTMTMATGGIANVIYTVETMTPTWIFPIYPLLIIGPHAAILSKSLPPSATVVDIIIGGFTLQGIGFLVAFLIYATFIYRLMTQKLPPESGRPGMFVSVGPSGFTVAAVLGMADRLSANFAQDFMGDGPMAAMILKVVANWACLWIWGLAIWFFVVSVGAHWSCARHHGRFPFAMTWFSFIFPQTALVTATFAVGKAFQSGEIQILGCVMTVALVLAWFMVFGMMIRAIVKKQILWPQKGEDRDEGGFTAPEKQPKRRLSTMSLSKITSNALASMKSNGKSG